MTVMVYTKAQGMVIYTGVSGVEGPEEHFGWVIEFYDTRLAKLYDHEEVAKMELLP